MIPAGYLAERYGAKIILATGFALWSIATLLTGVCSGFATLLLCRLLLGIGESTTFPCMSKLLASTSPPEQLGRANGITSVGYLLGPAVGTFLGVAVMVRYGWRSSFLFFGGMALLWIWPWLRTTVREPRLSQSPQAGPSWRQLLRQRGLWAASLGHFAGNYTFYFVLNWLPIISTRPVACPYHRCRSSPASPICSTRWEPTARASWSIVGVNAIGASASSTRVSWHSIM